MRETVFVIAVHRGVAHEERVAKIRAELLLERNSDGQFIARQKMVGCFYAVVVPEYRMIKECPAMDPLGLVFDHVGQIDISGLAKNLSIKELMVKFYGCGMINPGAITGICIPRGNGSIAPHTNAIQHQDVLHLMGKNVMRTSINPAARVFATISQGVRTLKGNLKAGKDYRESKRQEHGAALASWKAARGTNGGGMMAVVPHAPLVAAEGGAMVHGGRQYEAQIVTLMQQYSSDLASLRGELRAATAASAASFAAAEALREEAAEAENTRREEKHKMKQAIREQKDKAEEERVQREAAEKVEVLRLSQEEKAADSSRREKERAEDASDKAEGTRLAEERHKEIMDKTVAEMEISKKATSQSESLIAYLMQREKTLASKEDQAASNAIQIAKQSEALSSLAIELSHMREAREKATSSSKASEESGREGSTVASVKAGGRPRPAVGN